jgi:hypothetical protein
MTIATACSCIVNVSTAQFNFDTMFDRAVTLLLCHQPVTLWLAKANSRGFGNRRRRSAYDAVDGSSTGTRVA